jgi:hypothetical protein
MCAALAAIPKTIEDQLAVREHGHFKAPPRSIRICARSYPWVGEWIDQALNYHHESNFGRIASQEPIEACRAR